MSLIKKLLAAATILFVANIASAQQQQDPTPTYLQKYNAWHIECFTIGEGKTARDECQVYHVAFAKNPNNKEQEIPVLRISVAVLDKKPIMIFSAPLGVHLISGVKLQLDKKPIMVNVNDDKGKPVNTDITRLNYERCVINGCMAALPLDLDIDKKLIENIKKATSLNVGFSFDPDAKPKPQNVDLAVSLIGFTAAYDELLKRASVAPVAVPAVAAPAVAVPAK